MKFKIEKKTSIPIDKQRLFLLGETWIEVEDWFHLGDEVFDKFYRSYGKNEMKTLNLHLVQQLPKQEEGTVQNVGQPHQALNMPLKFTIELLHEGTFVSTFKIEQPFSSTISDLCSLIMEQVKGKKELQNLLNEGLKHIIIKSAPFANEKYATFLSKDELVADYLIGGGYKLMSVPVMTSNGGYDIRVKTLTGKEVELCVRHSDTIE